MNLHNICAINRFRKMVHVCIKHRAFELYYKYLYQKLNFQEMLMLKVVMKRELLTVFTLVPIMLLVSCTLDTT